MKNAVKRIEFASNIAILVVAVLLCVVLVKNYLLPKPQTIPNSLLADNKKQLTPGAALSLPGVDWAQNEQTLVLALSSACRFCSESAEFYQRLSMEHGKTKLIAVLPQPVEEGKKYLNGLNVNIDHVRQVSLPSFGVMSTPTLILVNRKGVAINSWVGKLRPDREREVLASLQ